MRRRVPVAALVALTLLGLCAPAGAQSMPGAPAAPADPAAVYALAGTCHALADPAGRFVARRGGTFAAVADEAGADRFRFQVVDLGRFLLRTAADDFLGTDAQGGVAVVVEAGPPADWAVEATADGGFRFLLASSGGGLVVDPATGALSMAAGGGAPTPFRLVPVDGCSAVPEVELNVRGEPHRGETPYEEVVGYADLHLHMTAFEFLGGRVHCGRPWHPYGVEQALVDCPDHVATGGAGAVLENVLGGEPVAAHDTTGWPTFRDWPAPTSLTHEQTYYRWVERAWRSGLRVLVNLLVENRALCEIYPLKQNDCDEMASVRLQAERLHDLERYIDAQHGGPGRGWFRIVDDPFEARQVANEGKLAVVLGIEVSEILGCGTWLGAPRCTTAQIDRQLDEIHAMGVRQVNLIHKFDNAFGGVAGDGGEKGLVINGGNLLATGRFWDFETCSPGEAADGAHDNAQVAVDHGGGAHGDIFDAVLDAFGGPLAVPLYPTAPHCNRQRLTDLGRHAIDGLADRGILVDVDHMGARTRSDALDVLEARRYPGVVSSHSWSSDDAYPRIYELGGVTAPYAGGSTGFVEQWRQRRASAGDPAGFGLGFGADSNGLGAQGTPRGASAENPVTYPFEGLGGIVIDRQQSGARTYDVNVDGVAHYGLYPDWIEDLRRQAGDQIVEDLARGAEAYLRTWERASGVPASSCRDGGEVAGVPAGAPVEDVLFALGQPTRRDGATFSYCVDGGGEAVVTFDGAGLVVASTSADRGAASAAAGAGAGGVAPADPAVAGAAAAGGAVRADGRPVSELRPVTGFAGWLVPVLAAVALGGWLLVRRQRLRLLRR